MERVCILCHKVYSEEASTAYGYPFEFCSQECLTADCKRERSQLAAADQED